MYPKVLQCGALHPCSYGAQDIRDVGHILSELWGTGHLFMYVAVLALKVNGARVDTGDRDSRWLT